MKNLNLLLSLSLLMSPMLSDAQSYAIPQAVQAADVVPGEMILKYKESYRNLINTDPSEIAALKNVINQLEVTSSQKIFAHINKPRKETNSSGKKLADLSLILSLKYQSNKDFREVAMPVSYTHLTLPTNREV